MDGKVEDKITIQPVAADAVVTKNGTNGHNGSANGVTNGVSLQAVDATVEEPVALQQPLSLDVPLPATTTSSSSTNLFDICPECGSGTLAYEEGCKKCYSCGYSEC